MRDRFLVLTTAIIIAGYAVFGLVMLAPEALYSGDIGVKYVQARALVKHRFTSLDMPYPGRFLDPHRSFSPLQQPFVMKTGGQTQAIFPPVSALLQAVAVGVAGLRGMIALSIAAAAVEGEQEQCPIGAGRLQAGRTTNRKIEDPAGAGWQHARQPERQHFRSHRRRTR